MATELFYANQARTTVTSGGTGSPPPESGSPEVWTVASSALFGAAATGVSQFHVADADPAYSGEIIAVTNVSGTTWTVTRGAENTLPVTHAAGFTVYQVVTTGYLNSALVNPMEAAGDMIYGGTGGVVTRLPGNATTTQQFLSSTGGELGSGAPVWATISADILPGSPGQTLTTNSSSATEWANAPVDWLNVVTMFGADPTGVADSTTAIQNAINAVPSNGGVVYLPAGTYKVSSTLTYTGLYGCIRGDGRWATTISFTGTGDCLRIYNTSTTGLLTGGGVRDLTIDGTSAGAGSTGLHYGDMRAGELRLAVQNFSGAGSIGVHFDNQYAWTEETTGYLWLTNCTQHIVFDVSGNATSTNSFGYTDLSAEIIARANQDGVVLQNGALLYNSRLTVKANFAGSGSAQSSAVLRLTGTLPFTHTNDIANTAVASGSNGGEISTVASWANPSGGVLDVASTTGFTSTGGTLNVAASGATVAVITYGGITGTSFTGCAYVSGSATGTVATGGVVAPVGYSALHSCRLDIQAECSSGGGSNAPQTIAFGTLGGNTLLGCIGVMDFAQGSLAFATSNWTALGSAGSFVFDGVIRGDFNLNNATVGTGTAYSFVTQGTRIYGKSLLSSANGSLFVDAGDYFNQTLTQSITVSLNPGGASTLAGAQRKVVVITQAASGGPYTVTWPSTGSPSSTNCSVVWAGGEAPVMSPAASAVDVYFLDTYDGATWYGRAAQASVSPLSQYLCTPSQYAPASIVSINTLSATMASVNAAATTVASGSNGGEISQVASWSSPSSGVLDVASTAGWPSAGKFTVATSTTTATCTYTGTTAATLTGCAYVSGSATGTVATGGAVTLIAAGAGAVAVPAISTGSFTAPPSGSVVVTANAVISSGGNIFAVGLAAHGTLTPMVCPSAVYTDSASNARLYTLVFVVGSLTPGTSYNFDLMFATSAGTLAVKALASTSTTPTGNSGAPVTITVQAV